MRGSHMMRPSTANGDGGGEPAQRRPRPLLGDPGDAGDHQRQRYGEPAFLQRKAERERERSDRAGGEDRAAASLPGRSLAPADRLSGKRKGAGKNDRGTGEGDRAVEAGDAVIERDQDGDGGKDGGCAPQDGEHAVVARCWARNPDRPNRRAKQAPSVSGAPNR